jgi:branched-chain amino acid aminotransferase
MDAVVFVNGRISRQEEARISVFDHGFLYGEGIYETLRTYGREPFLLDRHLARLRRSAELMELPIPGSDADLTRSVADTLAAHPTLDEAYIRILVTRGVGDLSYSLSACSTPTLVIIVKPLVLAPERAFSHGIDVALVGVVRNHPRALNPMIKSNNLLNNALAMQEAYRRGAEEALMLNQAGELAECSQSNIFLVKNGAALTPPLSAGLLPGITREFVLEVMEEAGLAGGEQTLTSADLESADEAFITGTTRQITPVVSIDGRPIRRGEPGPITRRLQGLFRDRLDRIRAATANHSPLTTNH